MMTLELAESRITLAYDDVGTGVPLVLLHAFPFDRTMWAPQTRAFADTGCRVLALDFPGFGGSTFGDHPFTIEGAADTVSAFLGALKIPRAIVGGLSMGGYVAMAFARRHPEQLTALILADTKAAPDDEAAREGRDKAIASVKADGVASVVEGLLPKLLSEKSRQSSDLVERVRAIGERQSPPALVAALAALRDRPDAVAGLEAVKVPTLAIVGEFDTVTPPLTAARIAAHVRGCELVHIPDAGHLTNLENPEAFNRAVTTFVNKLT